MFQSTCYDICPAGYQDYNHNCVAVGLLPDECSVGCGSKDLGNDICEPSCNVKACGYDNGLCLPLPENNTFPEDDNSTSDAVSNIQKLSFSDVPFPTTIAGVSSICVAGVARMILGTLMMSTTIGM